MTPVQSITDIILSSFLTNTAPQNTYLIVHYHLFYFILTITNTQKDHVHTKWIDPRLDMDTNILNIT